MHTELADILRYFALAEMCFSAGFVIRRLFYRGPYLRMIGTTFILYMSLAAIIIYQRIGAPLSWRTPIAIFAATLTLVAQIKYKDKEID